MILFNLYEFKLCFYTNMIEVFKHFQFIAHSLLKTIMQIVNFRYVMQRQTENIS